MASAKTLATVLHLHQGTPYVYQGEELGMTNTLFAEAAHYRDVESVNYHAEAMGLGLEAEVVMRALATKSRDNARTPMQWDDTSQAGFTDGVPWLPVNPNYVSVNAAAAMADPDSVFHHYRRLITLRRESVAVVYGRFALLLADDPQVWAFTRTHAQETLLVVANFSSAPAALDLAALPDLTSAQVLLATHPDHEPERLLPWESRLYRLSASG